MKKYIINEDLLNIVITTNNFFIDTSNENISKCVKFINHELINLHETSEWELEPDFIKRTQHLFDYLKSDYDIGSYYCEQMNKILKQMKKEISND